jgi:cbb3-type cytochrome oxidase maturation protein
MSVIVILIGGALLVAGGFLAAFIWAVRSGQYEDTCTPAVRMLFDEQAENSKTVKDKDAFMEI